MTAGAGKGVRRFVLLGDPVRHSVSPAMHAAAFRALGLRADYAARSVGPEALAAALRETAAAGGGGNVTLPHKERAAAVLDDPTPAVRAAGACNCFWGDEHGRVAGDNTDVGGFAAAAARLMAPADRARVAPLDGARVLLLGAGGAARAVAAACLAQGVGALEVLNRTVPRARALARALEGGDDLRVLGSAREAVGSYDLVANATSLGLGADDPLPLDLAGRRVGAALDLVYGPGETAWVRHARGLGIPAADGLPMLVRQAGLSLERWFPGVSAPLGVMRAAAERALDRDGRDSGRRDGGGTGAAGGRPGGREAAR